MLVVLFSLLLISISDVFDSNENQKMTYFPTFVEERPADRKRKTKTLTIAGWHGIYARDGQSGRLRLHSVYPTLIDAYRAQSGILYQLRSAPRRPVLSADDLDI